MPTSRQLAYASLYFAAAGLAFSIGLFNTAVTVLIALSLWSFLRKREWGLFAHPFFILALAYLAMNAVSLFQTEYAMASARGIVKVLKNLFLCFSVIYVVDSEDKFKKVFQWILIVACVVGADALIQGSTGVELLRGRDMTALTDAIGRVTGPFRHANDFSAYLSFVLLLFAGALVHGRKYFSSKKIILFAVGFAALSTCLVATYSRGAWLAVAAAVTLYALVTRSRLIFSVLLIAGLAGAVFAPPQVKTRALSLFNAKDGTIRERRELWAESARMIRESPWTGHGVNTYAKNEPRYKKAGLRLDNQYAHNGYLQMAAEIGLLGLASFLAAIAAWLISAAAAFIKSPPSFIRMAGLAIVFGILSFLLHSATDTNLQSVLLVNTLWMGMGLAWAARRLLLQPREVRRVLFVRTDRMGDLLMNLPAIRLLRQTYPKAWVTLLADASVAALLKSHPDLDEVMTVEAASLRNGFRARFELVRRLREARFDLAVVSNPDKWMHFVVFLADIPERVGWRRKWPFLLSRARVESRDKAGRHQMEWNLDLARLVSDKNWDGALALPKDPEALRRVEALLGSSRTGEAGLVAIHAGTSDPAKRWPADKFAELCRCLEAEGLGIVIVGGPEEEEAAARIADNCASAHNLAGRLSLPELSAFLGHPRVRLLISSDSGPVHIAWIQGTPVVALYAKNRPGSDPSRWGPRDPQSRVIYKPIDAITAEEVFRAALRVLQEKKAPAPC